MKSHEFLPETTTTSSELFSAILIHETTLEGAKSILKTGFRIHGEEMGVFFNMYENGYSGGGYGGVYLKCKISGPKKGVLDFESLDERSDEIALIDDDEEYTFEDLGDEPYLLEKYCRKNNIWAWHDELMCCVLDRRRIQILGISKNLDNDTESLDEEKLTELVGIKNKVKDLPKPGFKYPEPDEDQGAAGTRPLGLEWHDVMTNNGFTAMGSGSFGTVWEHPKLQYVLKVFRTTDVAYLGWVNVCIQNKNNPHFPKFISTKAFPITPEVSAIRMEKLTPTKGQLMDDIIYFIKLTLFSETRRMSKEETNLFNKYCNANPQLMDAIQILKEFSYKSGFKFDIHPGNFMLRGNTLVITDPVYDSDALINRN